MHSQRVTPAELLVALMARDGLNPTSTARKMGFPKLQSQLHRLSTGQTKEPARTTVEPLAELFGVSPEAFYSDKAAAAAADRLGLERQPDDVARLVSAKAVRRHDADIDIRQFDAGGSMGRGLVLRDQPGVIQGWRVSPEWLAQNVRNISAPTNLCIVTGFGDSMRPMFNPGDPLLVDRGVREVRYDAIYFFRVGDEGFIKRLQRIPGQGLVALSENKAYERWTITEGMEFEVFGRVLKVWRGEDF